MKEEFLSRIIHHKTILVCWKSVTFHQSEMEFLRGEISKKSPNGATLYGEIVSPIDVGFAMPEAWS